MMASNGRVFEIMLIGSSVTGNGYVWSVTIEVVNDITPGLYHWTRDGLLISIC